MDAHHACGEKDDLTAAQCYGLAVGDIATAAVNVTTNMRGALSRPEGQLWKKAAEKGYDSMLQS